MQHQIELHFRMALDFLRTEGGMEQMLCLFPLPVLVYSLDHDETQASFKVLDHEGEAETQEDSQDGTPDVPLAAIFFHRTSSRSYYSMGEGDSQEGNWD
jgi:hypothetical protein